MGTGPIGSGGGRAARVGSGPALRSDPMRLVLILGLFALASGCVHTRPAPLDTSAGRADLTSRTMGRVATLTVNGERYAARDLHIGPDETTWVDRLSGEPQSAPTADVSAVSMRRGRPWRALLIGAGIGVAVGVLAAVTDEGACGGFFCLRPTPAEYVSIFGLSGGMIGAAVGAAQTERFVPPPRLGVRPDTLARP